jgi:hypothetical protein
MIIRRSRTVLALAALAVLSSAACVPQRSEDAAGLSASNEPLAAAMPMAAPGVATALPAVAGREKRIAGPPLPLASQSNIGTSMLIRTGGASIEVVALEQAIERVRELADRLGGYVGNTSTQTGEGQVRSATLVLKIPAGRFDEAVNGLSPFGKVESVTVETQDVGEEFVDLTARTNNAKRLEERLLALLSNRTGKLEEVVNVERELARVREEIERIDGRLRYLKTRVAMSTLTISVHEPVTILPPRVGPGVMTEAFRQSWRNFVEFVAALVASLGWFVPLSVVATAIYLAWRRFGRRRPVALPPAPASPAA